VAADGHKDEGYYRVDGGPLGEKNPKWLQDDYVKFIRFAQRKIDASNEGIVGLSPTTAILTTPRSEG